MKSIRGCRLRLSFRRCSAFRSTRFLALTAFLAGAPLGALDVPLNTIQFPEKRSIDVPFSATPSAPSGATLAAEVEARGNQATVNVEFKRLQPAVLFGGQVNSYVLWAITRDGVAENLGEIFDRGDSGKNRFQTTQKEFGMIVTAEPIPGISRPSGLVVFVSQPAKSKYARNSRFAFSSFRPAPAHDVESVGARRYTQSTPLELYQAQRIYAMGMERGFDKYDARSMQEANTTLAQAANSTRSGGSDKAVTDYSRRTVSLVTSAGRAWMRAMQAEEAAAAAAKRAAEMDVLNRKAASAQQAASAEADARERAERERRAAEQNAALSDAQRAAAEQQSAAAIRAAGELAATSERLASEKSAAEQLAIRSELARREAEQTAVQSDEARRAADARTANAEEGRKAAEAARTQADDLRRQAEDEKDAAEKARLQSAADAAALEAQRKELTSERDRLAADNERVQKDRDALSQRLTGALQGIATTRTTARGVVVSLPGILFDTNKSTLKPNAQIGLAKMAGVLSVFPDMNLRVEGYTDSTGTDEVNVPLSKERAVSVASFLRQQGVASGRIRTEGYGSQFPVSSNSTASGKAENRRVEVVVAEGVVQAPGN